MTDSTLTGLAGRARWVQNYIFAPRVEEQGKVLSVGDGIVWIEGLPSAAMDEVLILEEGSRALVFHLAEYKIGAILLEQRPGLAAGNRVRHLTPKLEVPVGEGLLGRVMDPLGTALDGKGPLRTERFQEWDCSSPPITDRNFVNRPLLTGHKIVDALIPIGKGQRQLLIGDNGLGKSSMALDAVVNQKGQGVICVYVLVGQRRSATLQLLEDLEKTGALEHTVVVVAESTTLPGLRYVAPFAGCAVAEYWMRRGRDALIVYDDLTAHANSYRELSLLLRRPPGREAYPPDIFFLHSRLLERSTCLSAEKGGGSLTALPILETQEGEIASYIPTNLISITDGQIYFDSFLFASGFLPAVDITRSVSRVGGQAQTPEMKTEAGRIKLDYLQFLELEVFTRFGAKLEADMQKKINRGRVLREVLKQKRFSPLSLEQQMAWLIAYNEGLLDDWLLETVQKRLGALGDWVRKEGLTSSDPRAHWVERLRAWTVESKQEKKP